MSIFDEPKIDCHCHVLDPARFPYADDVAYRPAGQEIGPLAQYREVMDAYGITRALLVGLLVIGGALAGLVFAFAGVAAPLAIIASALAAVAISVALAWAAEGRRYISLRTLFRAPAYILWKLPIYFRLLRKREKSWVRTERR